MAQALYLAVLLSAACCSINAVSLDCGELSAADCKIQFETKFQNQIKQALLTLYQKRFNEYLDFWNAVLRELPENDGHFSMLQETVKELGEALPKLNEDFVDPNKMADVVFDIAYITKPKFYELNIDEESEKLFDEIKAKNGYEKFRELNSPELYNVLLFEVNDNWKQLYSGLRPTDRATYSQYEDINAQFQNANDEINTKSERVLVRLVKGLMQFFNIPLFGAFQHRA